MKGDTIRKEIKAIDRYIAFFEDKMAVIRRASGQFFRRGRGDFLTRIDVARSRRRNLEKKLTEITNG